MRVRIKLLKIMRIRNRNSDKDRWLIFENHADTILNLGFLPTYVRYGEFFVLQIITVRSTAFEAADPSGGSGSVEVKKYMFFFLVFYAVF